MDDTAKVLGAVATGYLLGRTRKMKLAIMAAGLLAGKKLPTSPREFGEQFMEAVENNPELSSLADQVKGNLMDSARAAAATTARDRVTRLTETIRDRTAAYTGAAEEGTEDVAETVEPEEGGESENAGGSAAKQASGTAKKASGTAKKASGTAKKTASRSSRG